MSELRHDPLTGHWVILAKNRGGRPEELRLQTLRRDPRRCPFCAGHEADTPPPVAAYGAPPDRPQAWRVRVVPNLYPAVSPEVPPVRAPGAPGRTAAGRGRHEVVIESPDHLVSWTQLDEDHVRLVLRAFRDRLESLGRAAEVRYVQLFKNVGAAAGASLEHLHSQLVGLPFVPPEPARQLRVLAAHRRRRGACLICQAAEKERRSGRRLVVWTSRLAAYCPYASRFPYQVLLLPCRCAARLEQTDPETLDELAASLRRLLAALESLLPQPAYNVVFRTAPFDRRRSRHYHWHIELIPRLANVAGFEWGTGCFINTVPPEEAAERLRGALPPAEPPRERSLARRKN